MRQCRPGPPRQGRRDVAHVDAIDHAPTRNGTARDEERRIHLAQLAEQPVRPGRRVRLDESAGDAARDRETGPDADDERGRREAAFAARFGVVEIAEHTARRVGCQGVERRPNRCERRRVVRILHHHRIAPGDRTPVADPTLGIGIDQAGVLKRDVDRHGAVVRREAVIGHDADHRGGVDRNGCFPQAIDHAVD